MSYFNFLSGRKCFSAPIRILKYANFKKSYLSYPDWLFEENKFCNLEEFFAALFEQNILVRYFLYLDEHCEINNILPEETAIFTLVLEDVVIWIGCSLLGYDGDVGKLVVKLIGQFVVIVSNYFLSKFWIFKDNKKEEK